jgi:hypothetical protein
VTLGKFAGQLLLESTVGITKLRGHDYPYRGAVLIPTLHPAYALRGGGEPLAQMRADFVRAKRALVAAGSTVSTPPARGALMLLARSRSVDETSALPPLAELARPGDSILLAGELGPARPFAQGFASARRRRAHHQPHPSPSPASTRGASS